IAAAWADFQAFMGEVSEEYLEPALEGLPVEFERAMESEEPAKVIEVGERLIAKAVELRVPSIEAYAALNTGTAYFAWTEGNRTANLERSRVLLERTVDIFDHSPKTGDTAGRVQAMTNLAVTLGERTLGDPLANRGQAVALLQRVLAIVTRESD